MALRPSSPAPRRRPAKGEGRAQPSAASPVARPESTSRPRYGPAFRAFTGASLVLAYLLMVLGDTVRVTESGMGCISWPLCNGTVGLAGSYHALLEQTHRYLAAVVTLLVTANFIAAWRHARRDRLVFWSAASSLGLIGVQVVLGAVTVLAHNAGWTVALHLAGAWLVLGAVTMTALGVWPWRVPEQRWGQPRMAPAGRAGIAAAGALFALAVSGMLVLHEGASNACPGWPVCGRWAGSAGLVALQYLHRSLAFVAAILITAAAARAWRYAGTGRALAVAAAILVGATAAVGAIVATTGAPPAAQGLHLALASALWVVLVAMAVPARPRAERSASSISSGSL